MDADHDPYPDDETTVYRYIGTGLALPDGTTVQPGETVALPEQGAAPIADLLEDLGECAVVMDSGEVCGRERPCPYHD